MFVGHYSAALAAKAVEPRAPLWTYVVAAQLVDIAWAGLVMGGVEKVGFDESLPGSPLDLYHMPFTHSLPGALAWSIAGALVAMALLKLPARAGLFVGLTVFSHWLLDLLVHRPDLEIWPGGVKLGFALWNAPVPEQAVEIGLLGVAAVFWAAQRVRAGRAVWPAGLFLALLVAVQVIAMVMPGGGGAFQFGLTALVVYLAVAGVAWLVERGTVDVAAGLPRRAVRA